MMQKAKRFALCALCVAMLAACGQMDTRTVTVTATERTITGRDTRGEAVTLTDCRTEEGERLLLEGVTAGRRYTVKLNTCGTWSREDDAIIKVKEAK